MTLAITSADKATVMLLAAGRGERLRPLTDHTPKPLLELHGEPLIVHHLKRLARCGVEQVVINLGWLGDQIQARLGDGAQFGLRIVYSQEPPGALETAGGIQHALPLLHADHFVVLSTDVLIDYPMAQLLAHSPDKLAHLIMVDNPSHHPAGDFSLINGLLCPAQPPSTLTFSGLAVFKSALFEALKPGWQPLRPVLEAAIADGEITADHHHGCWLDLGTTARLNEAQRWPVLPE